jgi:hypothetical protein
MSTRPLGRPKNRWEDDVKNDVLTLSLPKTTIVAPPLNVIKWQMGFNSAA